MSKQNEKVEGADQELEALKQKLAEAEGRAEAAEKEKALLAEKAEAAEKAVEEAKAEAEKAKAQAAEAAKGKSARKAKTESVRVVSATNYSYLIDGTRVTPDIPVTLERREGNLLDAQMKAGLIKEYE